MRNTDYVMEVVFICVLLFTFNLSVDTEFKLVSLNCNGFKSSQAYVQELAAEFDITFLSEH